MKKISCLFLSLILLSCSKDNLEDSVSTTGQQNPSKNLNLNQFADEQIKNNIIIDWSKQKNTKTDDTEIIEVNALEKIKTKITSNYFQKKSTLSIIVLKKRP